MKKIYKKLLTVTSIVAFSISCDNVDFGDTNVNPNSPSTANSASLLTGAERSMVGVFTTPEPLIYVQYLTNGLYPKETIYDQLNFEYTTSYVNVLRNLDEVIRLNQDPNTSVAAAANGSNKNQIAVATILRVFNFQNITDRFGMIPYSEALQGVKGTSPKFDTQEEIYDGLFKELESALAMIDDGAGPKGDVILNGKMNEWKRFANTLKMTMALRLSKKFPAAGGYAASKFNEALNAGTINTNSQNFIFPYIADENYDNPWQDRFETRSDYLMSAPFVNMLIGTGTNTAPQDPRLEKFADKSTIGGVYRGGNTSDVPNIVANYSFITKDIIKNGIAPSFIYTYAQISFAKAEAVTLGWISGNAATFYNEGVKASMSQWNVSSTAADTYLAEMPYVDINSIAKQKYIALFMQGYEGWNEWRRIGMNAVPLTKPTGTINGKGIPQRQAYGASVKTLNLFNYEEAVKLQGADDLDTKIWWAK